MTESSAELFHGRVSTYRHHKCRCRPCRDAASAHQREEYARRKARLAADPTCVEHGLASTYKHFGCRCKPCVVAGRANLRSQRKAQQVRTEQADPLVPHGTVNGYVNWACRCNLCREANRAFRRRQRSRRREKLATCSSVRHGTVHAYNTWLCRCNLCRDAATASRLLTKRRRCQRDRLRLPAVKNARHGTWHSFARLKCGCDLCLPAARNRLKLRRYGWHKQRWSAFLAKRRAALGVRQHGTIYSYENLGCRCSICVAAYSTYRRLKKQRAKERMVRSPGAFTHGTIYSYQCGCRCGMCLDAGRASRQLAMCGTGRRVRRVVLPIGLQEQLDGVSQELAKLIREQYLDDHTQRVQQMRSLDAEIEEGCSLARAVAAKPEWSCST